MNGDLPGNAPSRKAFWVCFAAGWTMMAFGLRGVLQHSTATHPPNLGAWFFGSALVHDFVVAPVVFLIAVVLGRLIPAWARSFVQSALLVSAMVVLVALPPLLSPGPVGNSSALPRNYQVGLLGVLAAVWGVTGLLLVVRRIRRG